MFGYNRYKDDPNVVGTTVIRENTTGLAQQLGLKKRKDIILNPVPSDHPDDPLNWNNTRKMVHISILFMFGLILGGASNWTGPIYVLLSQTLEVSLNQLNATGGIQLFMLAVSCLLVQPLAKTWGRRPVYLASTFLTVIAFIVFIGRSTYGGMMAWSVLVGLAIGPIDSLVEVTIGDIFFLHEHGKFMNMYIVGLALGSSLGPVLAGYIAQYTPTWKWCKYIAVILCAVLLLVQFFFLEESLFRRERYTDNEIAEKNLLAIAISNVSQGRPEVVEEVMISNVLDKDPAFIVIDQPNSSITNDTEGTIAYEKKGFVQKMKILSNQSETLTPKIFISNVLKPLSALRLPVVLLGAFLYGIQFCWLSLYTLTLAQFYTAPPYSFDTAALSNLSLAGVVGTLLASVYNLFSDSVQLWLCNRGNGLFEPEYRLVMNIFPTILNTLGIFLFGYSPLYNLHWFAGAAGICFLNFGMAAIISNILTYVLESYPGESNAVTSITCILFYRNIIGGVFTWAFQYWLDAQGVKGIVATLGAICLVGNSIPIIFWFYGKNIRKYSEKFL